jgi:hypothetical protein
MENIMLVVFFVQLSKRETHPHNVCLPFTEIRDVGTMSASPSNFSSPQDYKVYSHLTYYTSRSPAFKPTT